MKEEEPKKKPAATAAPSKSGSGQKRSKSSKSKQQMEGFGRLISNCSPPVSHASPIVWASLSVSICERVYVL